jgi:phage-related protein
LGDAIEGPGRHFTRILCHNGRKRVVVLRFFVKKTQQTPRREIDLVLERAKAVIS